MKSKFKNPIKILLTIFLFFLVNNHPVFSKGYGIKKEKYTLLNPYETICTHLLNLEKDNYRPNISAQAFLQEGISYKEARFYAIKLKQIFDNEGIYINIDNVPQATDYQDPTEKFNKYKLTHIKPEIYLVKVQDKWLYSRETLNTIDRLYNKINRFKSRKIKEFFPKSWNKKIGGISLWQYSIFFISWIFCYFFYLIVLFILNVILKFILKINQYTLALNRYMKHVNAINKAFSFSLIILFWLNFWRPTIQLTVDVNRYLVSFLKLVFYFGITLLFYRLIDGLSFFITRNVVEEKIKFQIDLLPLIRKVLKVCVIILSTLGILKALNFDVSAFLASISLGSLGIALASQDAIKNLFGSVMIFIDKPFSVGDMISTKDINGRVIEIGMRSTIIKTPDQTIMYVPNALLANTFIDNKGINTFGNYTNQIHISTKASMENVEEFILGFRNIIDKNPKILSGKSFVTLVDINEGSYIIHFSLFFEKVTYYKEMLYRHEILIDVIKLGESLNLDFEIKKKK